MERVSDALSFPRLRAPAVARRVRRRRRRFAARGRLSTRHPLHTYLLTIAYDGSGFAGWQRQAGFDSVQAQLEDTIALLTGEPTVVHGAGRTDAGVHALGQSAHVRIQADFEPHALLRAINGNLPDTVRVVAARRAPPRFHARFSAVGKRYVYRCLVSRVLPVFGRGRYCWIRRPVSLAAIRAGARHLVGEHDFVAFASNPGYRRKFGTVRRIDQLRVVRRPHGFDVFAQGNGFLYNQVRTIAGTLIEVGVGKRDPDEVPHILASKDRRLAGFNAPAEGLYLLRVLYPDAALGSDGTRRVETRAAMLDSPVVGRARPVEN